VGFSPWKKGAGGNFYGLRRGRHEGGLAFAEALAQAGLGGKMKVTNGAGG